MSGAAAKDPSRRRHGGQRKPEQRSFYDAVAKTLEGANQILLFGTGTGPSSAMAQLQLNLEGHHRRHGR